METLGLVRKSNAHALYEITPAGRVARFIGSTPGTRAICNDPFVVGCQYTNALRDGCAWILKELNKSGAVTIAERDTTVLHILRGGLNFGLREALAGAYGWNTHSSAFISAQRARKSENQEDWHITESNYKKVYLPKRAAIIFGDVVATGTSLLHGLRQILAAAREQGSSVDSLVFFTIGGKRSEGILIEIDARCKESFPEYRGATVIYIEGRFTMATTETRVSIKFTGTDLLRTGALVAPEFIESQYESPSYPIERCTIYDAGSRAFWLPEYLEDVKDYWEKTLELASNGMSFEKLLKERFPELDHHRFVSNSAVSLTDLCLAQIAKAEH